MVGRGVIMHQHVSIGADGFGYRPAPDGRGLTKMPHIGKVIIEDGVEIGAGTCIDRAKFGSTVIGAGTKIDNLVQIAHNCQIGRCCLIAGQSGLGGSVTLGDGVILGGAAGVVEHMTIGAGARVGARSLVTRHVPPGASRLGTPADDAQSTMRQWASVRQLPEVLRRMKAAESGRDPASAGEIPA
jgi:UDP-3-O-[3-hydroxymyristoyl] glucosamine N-acyltransferase